MCFHTKCPSIFYTQNWHFTFTFLHHLHFKKETLLILWFSRLLKTFASDNLKKKTKKQLHRKKMLRLAVLYEEHILFSLVFSVFAFLVRCVIFCKFGSVKCLLALKIAMCWILLVNGVSHVNVPWSALKSEWQCWQVWQNSLKILSLLSAKCLETCQWPIIQKKMLN